MKNDLLDVQLPVLWHDPPPVTAHVLPQSAAEKVGAIIFKYITTSISS